jgi:hypothetical protein
MVLDFGRVLKYIRNLPVTCRSGLSGFYGTYWPLSPVLKLSDLREEIDPGPHSQMPSPGLARSDLAVNAVRIRVGPGAFSLRFGAVPCNPPQIWTGRPTAERKQVRS